MSVMVAVSMEAMLIVMAMVLMMSSVMKVALVPVVMMTPLLVVVVPVSDEGVVTTSKSLKFYLKHLQEMTTFSMMMMALAEVLVPVGFDVVLVMSVLVVAARAIPPAIMALSEEASMVCLMVLVSISLLLEIVSMRVLCSMMMLILMLAGGLVVAVILTVMGRTVGPVMPALVKVTVLITFG